MTACALRTLGRRATTAPGRPLARVLRATAAPGRPLAHATAAPGRPLGRALRATTAPSRPLAHATAAPGRPLGRALRATTAPGRRAAAGGAVAVAGGYAADLVLGDPARWHPVAGFGRAAAALERVTYRPSRAAGAVHVALLLAPVLLLGRALERSWLGRVVAVWVVLGGRSLHREARAVGALVTDGDLAGARRRIPALVGRNPEQLDATQLTAAAIESVAENTVDAVVAPLLWAGIAGAPGALGYRAVNTLDAMVGHRSDRYARFGTPAARLDDLLNYPAARLTAALTAVCSGRPRPALRAWRRDAPAHPSPNAGCAEAAFAGALGLRLGGPLTYGDRVEHRPVLGDGAAPGPADVRRAVALAQRVGLASAGLIAVAAR